MFLTLKVQWLIHMHSFSIQYLHISAQRMWLYYEPNQLTKLINDFLRLYIIWLEPAFFSEFRLAVSG
jgi:hypothetical protein